MFKFFKKLGQRIKNIFKRPDYKKLYKESVKQQKKDSEKIKSLEKENQGLTEKVNEYKQKAEKFDDYIAPVTNWTGETATIQNIPLGIMTELFNRGDFQLGKLSKKKPNRYLTTNPEFLDKWYEVLEKDQGGIKPKFDISSHLSEIKDLLERHFDTSRERIIASYSFEYDGDWKLLELEDSMNIVFTAFDISPAREDTIIRR